jgi:hypothetical protein
MGMSSLRLLRLSSEERRATRAPCWTLIDRSPNRAAAVFLMFARAPRDDASPCGEPWPREGRCSCWLNRFRKPQR